MGPESFGKLSLVLAYYTIFFILIDFGISRFITREVSPRKDLAGVYLANHLLVQILVAFLTLAFFVVVPRLFDYEPGVIYGMLLVGIGLMIGAFSIPFRVLADVWQRLDIASALNFLNTILTASWMALAIYLKRDFIFIFWVYIVIGLLSVVFYWVVSRRWTRPVFEVSFPLMRRMLLFGMPFALISGFELLIQKVDAIIQKFYLPFEQLGYYSAAYRFLDFLTFIPAVAALSLFPFLAEAVILNKPEVTAILNRLNRYLILLALPLGVAGTVFAPEIIRTLFDASYDAAAAPFQILIWVSAITFIYAVPNVIMQLKRTSATAVILAVVTVLNAGANWFFLSRGGGIIASAWITFFSYVLIATSFILIAQREAVLNFIRYLFWPGIATALMVVVMLQLRGLNFYFLAALGGSTYLAFLFVVRFIKKDDLLYLRAIFTRQ